MSHDALYIVRDRGVDRLYHSSWGGLRIAGLLLRHGPSELLKTLRQYPEWRYGLDAGWLTGCVLVDADRRLLLYWADQFDFADEREPELLRCFALLLERDWPAWTTRWMVRPSCELGDALGGGYHDAFDGRMEREPICATVAECADMVRPASDYDATATWVTVREPGGALRDHRLEFTGTTDADHVLVVGPVLLEHLAAQPPAAAGDEPEYETYDHTLFVDVPGRRLAAWSETSGFRDRAYHADRLWPGWSAVFHDGGDRIHWSLTGRADDAFPWHSRTFESLCRVYERHLEHELDDATRDELARIAARADESLALDARRAAADAPAPATFSTPADPGSACGGGPVAVNTQWLVRHCRASNQAAWDALVRRYSGYVHAVITRVFALPRDEAEGVFQLVWLRIYARLHTLKDDAALRPWVRQVTLNVTRDHLSAGRGRRNEVPVDDIEPSLGDAAALAELDDALDVHELLEELPERCGEILTRRFVVNQPYMTIAAAHGMTVGQISGAIHRCLGRLRELLGGAAGEAGAG